MTEVLPIMHKGFLEERPGKKGKTWFHEALSWRVWQLSQELIEKDHKIGICYRSVHPKGKEISHSLVSWKKLQTHVFPGSYGNFNLLKYPGRAEG